MLRPRVSLFGEQCGEDTRLGCHGVDGVLHHGELASRHCPQRAMVARGDADRMLNLLPRKAETAARYEWRHERRQRRVMPSTLTDAGKRRFTEPHFEFVAQDEPDDKLTTVAPSAITSRHGRREDVGRMRRI